MKTGAWFFLIPGLLLAVCAIALIAIMTIGTPEWSCSCSGSDHWSYKGPDMGESEKHFDATRHTTSCKRTDQSAKILDRVFGLLFPGHEG